MKFRAQVTWLLAIFSSMATLLAGFLILLSERGALQQKVAKRYEDASAGLTQVAQEAKDTGDDLMLIHYIRQLKRNLPALAEAAVADPSGKILVHSEPSRIGGKLIPFSEAEIAFESSLTDTTKIRLTFYKKNIQEEVSRDLAESMRWVLSGIFLSILVSLIAGWMVAMRFTRPLEGLSRAALRLADGDLHQRVPVQGGREIAQLCVSFNTMADGLERLDEMKEDFVSSVTHELRSPLGVVRSYLGQIEKEASGSEVFRDSIQRIKRNIERLQVFVDNLLDVAKIERGKTHLRPSAISLHDAVGDAILFFREIAREKQIALTGEIRQETPGVWVDMTALNQILTNLISNAFKFTPAGGLVKIASEDFTDGQVTFFVQDTGLGISEEDQKKVFSKFEQIKSSRAHVSGPKGTGLGLAIVKGLVEASGGEIRVSSKLGSGATFYVSLPRADAVSDLKMPAAQHS